MLGGSVGPRNNLLTQNMTLKGTPVTVMLDTGSSISLISSHINNTSVSNCPIIVSLLDGSTIRLSNKTCVTNLISEFGLSIKPFDAYLANSLPHGIDVVLGLNAMTKQILDDFWKCKFNTKSCDQRNPVNHGVIKDKDFTAQFLHGAWRVDLNLLDCANDFRLTPASYVKPTEKEKFDEEIREWIKEDILVPHDIQKHGEVKNFLPTMAVTQSKGDVTKVRPVFDFRQFNKNVSSHPGGAVSLCADRLRQ